MPIDNLQRILILTILACQSTLLGICFGPLQQPSTTAESRNLEKSLKAFLQHYLRGPSSQEDKATKFSAVFVDLNGDGVGEAVVYVTGGGWCGTGGCKTLVLKQHERTWEVIANITITRPPIRVLNSIFHGWRSIAVWVQGGGLPNGYEAELRFNGRTYPNNPSVFPAQPLNTKTAGKVIIASEQEETPLYP